MKKENEKMKKKKEKKIDEKYDGGPIPCGLKNQSIWLTVDAIENSDGTAYLCWK